MQSVVGIFNSRVAAEQAVRGLLARGLSPQSITFLSGEAGSAQVANLPTTDAEPAGDDPGQQQPRNGLTPAGACQKSGGIGTEAKECGVTQRRHPVISKQQIERQCEQAGNQDLPDQHQMVRKEKIAGGDEQPEHALRNPPAAARVEQFERRGMPE